MEFISLFLYEKTLLEIEISFNKNRRHLTYALYITCIKSFFINFSLLSRLVHSHAVSVGARLASVDPLSTSFLLPNQVISEVGRIFHPGDSYRCMHDMNATSSVLITSDASFDRPLGRYYSLLPHIFLLVIYVHWIFYLDRGMDVTVRVF